jgi:hypothetical protein
MARQPLYLARESYRRRRLTDAARLLPVLGILLIGLPVLWDPGASDAQVTAWAKLYLFSGWLVLIVAAFLLSRALSRPPDASKDAVPPGEGPA